MFKHKNTSLYLFPSDSAETDLSWDARAGKSAMEAASEWKRLSEDRENKKGVIISLSWDSGPSELLILSVQSNKYWWRDWKQSRTYSSACESLVYLPLSASN